MVYPPVPGWLKESLMFLSAKQESFENFKKFYTSNYSEGKGSCRFETTVKKRTKNGEVYYERLFPSLREFHQKFELYKQNSTGLTHYEREIVVVDVDENIENPIEWARDNLPIMPGRYSQNL
jgi:hypothetical protein